MLKTKKGQELDATKIILHSANEIYQQKKEKRHQNHRKLMLYLKTRSFKQYL